MSSFLPSDPKKRARALAKRLRRKVQTMGTRQARWHAGMLLTYPYPARPGYGVRGVLVGVYSKEARLKWIEEDLLPVILGEQK